MATVKMNLGQLVLVFHVNPKEWQSLCAAILPLGHEPEISLSGHQPFSSTNWQVMKGMSLHLH